VNGHGRKVEKDKAPAYWGGRGCLCPLPYFSSHGNWVAIIFLIGVALGWALTQTSSWLATRQADKGVSKEVLYFLLDLHRIFGALERVNRLLPRLLATITQYTTPPPPNTEEYLAN
jgi:hypothetical protein